jgi:hypothetical protein
MVKKPLIVAGEFDGVAKRVGEVCALSSDPMVRPPQVLRTSTLEATVTEGDWVSQRSGESDVTGSVVALPARGSNRGAPAASDDDATLLALQLCEQVREYRRPQPKGAGANVVWLFR